MGGRLRSKNTVMWMSYKSKLLDDQMYVIYIPFTQKVNMMWNILRPLTAVGVSMNFLQAETYLYFSEKSQNNVNCAVAHATIVTLQINSIDRHIG